MLSETFDNNKYLKIFKNFDITATEQDIDEFVAIDDGTSHVFQDEILGEANLLLFEEHQSVNKDENMKRLQASNILDNIYRKSITLEGELFSTEMQAAISKLW